MKNKNVFIETFNDTIGEENVSLAMAVVDLKSINRMERIDLARLIKEEKEKILYRYETFRGYKFNAFMELQNKNEEFAKELLSDKDLISYISRGTAEDKFSGAASSIIFSAKGERDKDPDKLDRSLIRVASDPASSVVSLSKERFKTILKTKDPDIRLTILLCKKKYYTDDADEAGKDSSGNIYYDPDTISSEYHGLNQTTCTMIMEAADKYGVNDVAEHALCFKNLYSCTGAIHQGFLSGSLSGNDEKDIISYFLKGIFTGEIKTAVDPDRFMYLKNESKDAYLSEIDAILKETADEEDKNIPEGWDVSLDKAFKDQDFKIRKMNASEEASVSAEE